MTFTFYWLLQVDRIHKYCITLYNDFDILGGPRIHCPWIYQGMTDNTKLHIIKKQNKLRSQARWFTSISQHIGD